MDKVTKEDWDAMRRMFVALNVGGGDMEDVVSTALYLAKKYPFEVIAQCSDVLRKEARCE